MINRITDPVEAEVPWLPFGAWAITVFPLVLYLPERQTPCIRAHELVHWHHQREWMERVVPPIHCLGCCCGWPATGCCTCCTRW